MMAKLVKVFVLLLIAVAVALVLGGKWAYDHLRAPLALPLEGVQLEVKPGETLTHVIDRLEQEGILNDGWILNAWARYQHQTLVQRGEYDLQSGITPLALLEQLNRGDVIQYRLTIVEGTTFQGLLTQLQ